MGDKIISAVINTLAIVLILIVSVFTILVELGRQAVEAFQKGCRALSSFRYRNKKMITVPRRERNDVYSEIH